MTAYEPGEVILVPYPFGERAGGRKRPVLVISSAPYNQETGQLIVAQITGRVSAPPHPGDYRIEEWRQAHLPRPALVRARLATVEDSLVLRKLGRLSDGDLRAALAAVQSTLWWVD
jgi:mRNA interferase MazF